MMITDKSGIPHVGLAVLRTNAAKLKPVKEIRLLLKGEQQVLEIDGAEEDFESNSFGWGRDDERTVALAQALNIFLEGEVTVEYLTNSRPDHDHRVLVTAGIRHGPWTL